MTLMEFTGQFRRLCDGFQYEATREQTDAWFRRIGHYALSVWAEAVTTLLCGKYYPKLDEALKVLESEADAQRRAAVEQEKSRARKVYTLLTQPVSPQEASRLPMPGTPLFACIKAFAGRAEVWKRLTQLEYDERHTESEQARERVRLQGLLAQYEQDIREYSPLLHDEDAGRLVRQYESGH